MGQAKSKSGDWRRLSESDCLALLAESHLGQIPSIITPNGAGNANTGPGSSTTRDDLYLHRYRNQQKQPVFRSKNFNIPNGTTGTGDRLLQDAQYVREQFPSLEQRPRSAMEREMPLIQFDSDDDAEDLHLQVPHSGTNQQQLQNHQHQSPNSTSHTASPLYAQVRKVQSPKTPTGSVQLRRQLPPPSIANRLYARRSMYPTSATGNMFHIEPLPPPPQSEVSKKSAEMNLRVQGPSTSAGTRRMRPISMFPVSREVSMMMAPNSLNGRMSYAEMLEECNTLEHCACDLEGCLVEDDQVPIGTAVGADGQVPMNPSSTQVGAIREENDDLLMERQKALLVKQTSMGSQTVPKQPLNNSSDESQNTFEDFQVISNKPIEQQQVNGEFNMNDNSADNNLISINGPDSPEVNSSPGFVRRGDQRMEDNSRILRCSGLECLCDRCVAHRFKLLNWLLPNCTRINAERLLQGRPNGTFLVRKSEKFPGQYTLSFVCRRTVRHCLIMRSVYGFGLRWPYSFETLQQVIIHYVRTSLVEFNSKLDTRLRYPVFMT